MFPDCWVQSFAVVVDKAEEVRSALESDGWETGGEDDNVAVPDALELSFQVAVTTVIWKLLFLHHG